ADIDTYVTCIDFVAELPRTGTTTGKEAGHIAVMVAVDELQRRVYRWQVDQTHHRTEDFGLDNFAAQGYILQYRRLHEVTRFKPFYRRFPPIQQQLRTFVHPSVDELFNTGLA